MQGQAEHINTPIIKDDEIDLIEVAKTIWAGRKLILKVTGVFLIIGLIIAFGSNVEYEASCKLLPGNNENANIYLGGLGGLAGIDIGGFSSSTGAIPPKFNPEISRSLPYVREVMNKPIMFMKHKRSYSSFEYFVPFINHPFHH